MKDRKKYYEENLRRGEELGRQIAEEEPLGCKDIFSMIFSAYLVIFLVTAAALVGVGFLLLWIIGAL